MKNTTEKQIITLTDGKVYTRVATSGADEYFEDANKAGIILKDDGKLYVLFNGVYCPYDVDFEIIEPETESEEDIEKRELNKAIYEVLTNKYKKDAYEAHDKVKNAGYEIEKWSGVFHVKNEETGRVVCVERHCGRFQVRHGGDMWSKCPDKFDFVNCLNKPTNKVYWSMVYEAAWGVKSKARERYEQLKSAKWYVGYHEDSLKEAERKLEKAMEQYEHDVKYHEKELKRSSETLANLRAKLGLAS